MATSDYRLSKFLFKIIILTYCGHVLTRSIPSRSTRHHNVPSQFPYPLVGSLPVQPIYYNPIPQVYQHHMEPTGTFYDRKRGILRSFPGGGIPLLVDYQKRCSNNYVGIKPHPNQSQYYYVCKPDCVVFGKCQNLQAFDASKSQCVPHPQPDYTPICKKPGRFPIFGDCTTYYRCDTRLRSQVFSCPRNTVFSPQHGKCICDAKCSPTIVSPYGTHIPQDGIHKFPPCIQDGTFRTPTDCSLYYTCALQPNRIYLQTRYSIALLPNIGHNLPLSLRYAPANKAQTIYMPASRCPELTFYDTTLGVCRPQHEVACDAIQLSELVYPRQSIQPRLPAVYPPYYSLDSLEDNQLSTENSMSNSKEENSSSVSSNEDSQSTEVNNQVIGSPREKMPPSLTSNAQRTTELTIPLNTHTPTTIPYPTATPTAIPTDYTTLHSVVGTENPMYTNTHSTENMVQYYPSTQITLPPTDQIKYVQFSHHERPNTLENTLDETDLRNIRSSLTKTATDNEVYIRRKGHLNAKDFKNVLDSYKFDSNLPPTTQSPIQHKWADYARHQTTETSNKLILPAIRNDLALEATTSTPSDEHEGVTIIIEEPEGALHEMQSNETLDDVSYYEDDAELDEVLPATQKRIPSATGPNLLPTQINQSESSSNLDDPTINNVPSQLPNPLKSEETNEAIVNPADEPTATAVAGPATAVALGEDVAPHEGLPQREDVAPHEGLPQTEGLIPQKGLPPLNDPTLTDHVRERLDAADADPATTVALGEDVAPHEGLPQTEGLIPQEGLPPLNDPTPTDHVREKLDAADADPATAVALGEDVAPHEGLPQRKDVAPHEGLPQTEGLVPQEGLPQTEGVVPHEGLPQREDVVPHEGLPQTEGLVPQEGLPQTEGVVPHEGLPQREDVVPHEGLPQTEGLIPQEGFPPLNDPTPTDHVRERLDAADADPATTVALGEDVAPHEGLPQTEGLVPHEVFPQTGGLASKEGLLQTEGVLPHEGLPQTKGIVPQEGLPLTEGVVQHQELPPSSDPKSTDHVREKLDAADAAALGEEVAPHERLLSSVDPIPEDLVREKLDAVREDSENAPTIGEVIPPSIHPTPTDTITEEVGATNEATPASPSIAPLEEEVIAPIEESLIPTTLSEVEQNLLEPGKEETDRTDHIFPPIESTPANLIREKLDAELPPVLGEDIVPPKRSSPPIEPTPNLVREKLDAELPPVLGEDNVPPKGSSPPIEPISNLVREKLDAELPPVLGEDNVLPKGSSPNIEPIPNLVREKLDAELPPVLGEDNVPPKASSPPIEPIPNLVREKLDTDQQTPLELEDKIDPQQGLSPMSEGPIVPSELQERSFQESAQMQSNPTDPVPNNLYSIKASSTETLAEHSTAKSWPMDDLAMSSFVAESSSLAVESTTQPFITDSRNKSNILPGDQENEIGYNGGDGNESQMNNTQTRLVKSVEATKEALDDEEVNPQQDAATTSAVKDFETGADVREDLNHSADIGNKASTTSLDTITEPTAFGVSENVPQPTGVTFENTIEITTANEIDTIKVDSDTTTSRPKIQATTESAFKISDLEALAEHQSSTTDMSSMILSQTNSVTTESLTKVTRIAADIVNDIVEERSDIPASMENEIAVVAEPQLGQEGSSTNANMSSTNTLIDAVQNPQHLTEQSINAETEPQDTTEPKHTDIEGLDNLIMDLKASTIRPIRNAAIEEAPVNPLVDNDESNLKRSSTEEAMNNTPTESIQLSNKEEAKIKKEFEEKELEEVFNMENSSEATTSSTNTMNSEINTNRDIIERHTSSEHKETARGFQNQGTKLSKVVRDNEANASEEMHPKDFSNIVHESNISTKPPFDESSTTELESTTEGILPIKEDISVDGNNVVPGAIQIEDAHVRVVKSATGAPPTNQASPIEDTPQTNSEKNVWGTANGPTKIAEIGKDFEQKSEIFKKTDLSISPMVKHDKVRDSLNFINDQMERNWNEFSDTGEMNLASTGRGPMDVSGTEAKKNLIHSQNQARDSLDNKFAIPDKREIPADVLERATGLIRIDDNSPVKFQTADLLDNADSHLLATSSTFSPTNPTTELSEKALPKTKQTSTEPKTILNSTTTTNTETTTQDLSTGANTETLATQEALMAVQSQGNFVDSTSDNLRIVRYTKDTNQYSEAIKKVYRKHAVPYTNSQIVTEDTLNATDIPKMEVVVFGDLDLSVLFCGNKCNATHEHKYGKNSFGEQHAVGVQWDPVNSNKTMSLVTA